MHCINCPRHTEAATAPKPGRAGVGRGRTPRREQDPSRLRILLGRCLAKYPQLTKTGFPAPVLLPCLAALLPQSWDHRSQWDRILGVEPQAPQSPTTPTACRHAPISHVGQDPAATSHPHHPVLLLILDQSQLC